MHYKNLKIVPIDQIPKDIIDVPLNDLKDIYRICLEMHNLCILHNGVGLSAVQVGIPWRLFVAVRDISSLKPSFRNFINCDYTPISDDKISSLEGCLSIKNLFGELKRFRVNRYKKIKLIGKELLSQERLELTNLHDMCEGDEAVIYQHESDHHAGILISDIGEEVHVW